KHPVPVVLSGGLFRSSMVTESVTAELLARVDVQPVRPALPPIGGACILALLTAGVPETGEVMAALREGLVESELGGYAHSAMAVRKRSLEASALSEPEL